MQEFKFNLKIKKNNKIFCKNFIFFFLLIKYFQKKTKIYKNSVFVKPKTKKLITILRPPYKNKLSRHQITNERRFILLQFKIDLNINKNMNYITLKQILIWIKNFFFFFETNLIYQHKLNFFLDYYYKNNFLIK